MKALPRLTLNAEQSSHHKEKALCVLLAHHNVQVFLPAPDYDRFPRSGRRHIVGMRKLKHKYATTDRDLGDLIGRLFAEGVWVACFRIGQNCAKEERHCKGIESGEDFREQTNNSGRTTSRELEYPGCNKTTTQNQNRLLPFSMSSMLHKTFLFVIYGSIK
jgi:hypothetical protein